MTLSQAQCVYLSCVAWRRSQAQRLSIFSAELWLAECRRSRAGWQFSNVMSRLHKHAVKPSHTYSKTYLHLYIDTNDKKRKESACQSWQDRPQKVNVNKKHRTASLSRRHYSHVRTFVSGEIKLLQFLDNTRQQISDILLAHQHYFRVHITDDPMIHRPFWKLTR